MNELLFCRIAGFISVIILMAVAVWCWLLNQTNLPKFEPWPRKRLAGLLLGWVVLAGCVSHAAVVSPGFLLPLLWPLAIVAPVFCYFFVDYLTARAIGGAMILWSYYLVHKGFEFQTPLLPVLAVLGWGFGIAGLWISGKPCTLRDWIRLCAKSSLWRHVSAVYLLVLALVTLLAAIMTKGA